MRTIWKYNIYGPGQMVSLRLPQGSKVASVGLDGAMQFCVWMEVDPHMPPTVMHHFQIIGTGDLFERGECVGTIFQLPYVWHVLHHIGN